MEFAFFLVNLAISLSVLIVVVSLIVAGFKYILSMGDEEKVKGATRSLAFSLLGLVIVFLSPRIIEFIIDHVLKP
jgi:type IV secretory pathway VirB2 component (pilin)